MTVALFPIAPFAWAADGAGTLSLPQLLEELQQVSPGLAAARKRWEAVQAKIPQATGLPAPKIGVEFEEIPRGSVKLNKATIMYQLLQSLPFPGKLSLRHQVAVKEAQMAASEFKRTEWELISMLKEIYYELFLIDREMETQQESIAWLSQALASAHARYATGNISQAQLLQLQAESLEASNRLSVLHHRRQAAAAHLNHLLNRAPHTAVGDPAALELSPVPETPEALFAMAKENQPDLLTFKFSAERSSAAWRLSKRELWPDLETMLELRNPAMGPIGPWDLTLALVLPFWFWTKQRYGVKAALYDKESAEAAYQGMSNEIQRRIHEHWHQAQAAYATALLCQEQLLPLGSQAVGSLLAGYSAGNSSFLELTEALAAYQERRRTYFEHLVLLEQQMVLLEQAVGVPLREDHRFPLSRE